METYRSISVSKARAALGVLLDSLASEGPVEITRNGRVIAIIAAPRAVPQPNTMARLPALARSYAAGEITWRQVQEESDASFGDLLVELSAQGLQLPRARAEKNPRQAALLDEILSRAKPDSST